MAGDSRTRSEQERSGAARSSGFNPVWLAAPIGAVGVGTFLFSFFLSTSDPAAPVREVGLLLFGCAIVVISLERVIHARDNRHRLRNELVRRMSELDGALQHLGTSMVALESVSAVKHRSAQVGEVFKRAERFFTKEELAALAEAQKFAEDAYKVALESRGRRSDLDFTYSVVANKLEAAERRGDIDYKDAAMIRGILASSKSVLDTAMLAEWNSSHRGRLEMGLETAASHLRTYKSTVAEDLYQGSAELFRKFHAEVDEKIKLLDKMSNWNFHYNRLQDLINGIPPEDLTARRPAPKPARPSARYPDFGGGPGPGPGGGGGGEEVSAGRRPANNPIGSPSAPPGGGMAASGPSAGAGRAPYLSVVPTSSANDPN
jgi:hypothetical protein